MAKRKSTSRAKPKARKKSGPLVTGPSPAEERKFRAQGMALDAFRDSPEFKRATNEAVKVLEKAERQVKKAIKGKS